MLSLEPMRRLSPGVVFAFLVSSVLACSWGNDDHERDDDNFRPDVIVCEDALARLESCCPDFEVGPVRCDYFFEHREGCGSSSTDSTSPALTEEESRCIRQTSCDDLVTAGVCERAQDARALTSRTSYEVGDPGNVGTTTGTRERVCP